MKSKMQLIVMARRSAQDVGKSDTCGQQAEQSADLGMPAATYPVESVAGNTSEMREKLGQQR